ncbi:hypothetical protein ADK82_08540, partial [Streptomyces sp. NRRL S-4]
MLRSNTAQHHGQRGTIRHITRDEGRLRAQLLQLRNQIGSPRSITAPPAHQQQMTDTTLHHQMPRHQPTQRTTGTRHQHRAHTIRLDHLTRTNRRTGKPRHEHH